MKSRSKAGISVLLACAFVLSAALSGCGGSEKGNGSAAPANGQSSAKTVPVNTDPLGKYNPAVDIHSASFTGGTTKFPKGDDINNNVWTRELKDTLGINWKWDWLTDSTQYDTKLNTAIASGDIPDVFMCNANQLSTLAGAGKLADLSDAYKQYASPLLQKAMNEFPQGFNSGKIDNKLYGISEQGGGVDFVNLVWIRDDWMKKLGLSAPKTMGDVLKIADAFVKQDPDGDKKNDTYGIALENILLGDGFANLEGFFNAYHAYPQIWIKDSSGKAVYGSIQPEMKKPLQVLQDLYKSGVIDKEFGVKNGDKVVEDIAQNKVGIEFGQNWNGGCGLNNTVNQNKNATWTPYPVMSADDKPAISQEGWPVKEYTVVNKDYQHPEAAIKIINLKCEKYWGKTGNCEKYFSDGKGMEPMQYIQMNVMLPNKNIENMTAVAEALKTGDTSKMNSEAKGVYQQVAAYAKDGKVDTWGAYAQAGPTGAFAAIKKLMDNHQLLMTANPGITTPTMVQKQSTLDKIEKETVTKIITGSPVDATFDKFVSDYKALGGDQITTELNSALKK